jgi:hypothetical protein
MAYGFLSPGQNPGFEVSVKAGTAHAATHEAVGFGLLGVGGLNQRIEFMETLQAMTGFQSDELPLMESKLRFLTRQVDPDIQDERFERIVELVGLPAVDANPDVHDVDLERLLEVVADVEAQAFRRWLRGVDSLDEDAVRAEIHKIRDLLSRAVRSGPGNLFASWRRAVSELWSPSRGWSSVLWTRSSSKRLCPHQGRRHF